MAYNKDIVEKLSQFNNKSFTKKQWETILKGCECPKSSYFWAALKDKNLQKEGKIYTLIDVDAESFDYIWSKYSELNLRFYNKQKAKKKAEERKKRLKNTTLYIINGVVTTINPKDEN